MSDNPLLNDPRWVIDNFNAIFEYVIGVDRREKAAAERHRELVRIQQDGWKQALEALGRVEKLLSDAARERR
jgi:hypothetical protein